MSLTDQYQQDSAAAIVGAGRDEAAPEDGLEKTLLNMARTAKSQASLYASSSVRSAWERAYKAFQSKHFAGSKYLSEVYRGRSKIFRPKTRSSVRKNEASAAQALFSTVDTVSIQPGRADQQATIASKVMHEIINYRFDRSSGKKGLPWFMMAMGARQDSQITGMCISKQYWQFEQEDERVGPEAPDMASAFAQAEGDGEEIDIPMMDAEDSEHDQEADEGQELDGFDDPDGLGGLEDLLPADLFQPEAMLSEPAQPPKVKIDRPWIELIPPENVTLDPAAPWHDPIQEGSYLRVRFPLHLHEVRGLMKRKSNRMGGGAWKTVPDTVLKQNAQNWYEASIRRARDGDTREDRMEEVNHGDLSIVWVTENFFKYEGVDYHFWSVDESHLLTEPVPVEEAYPAHNGSRPYVGGFGALEAHKVYPTSPVESWQQLQQEANDLANLRLDNIKQHLSPLTKARRGQGIDLKNLRNRGPDSTILLNNLDDVVFDRPQDVSGNAYAEMNYLNADFDDIAGSFSGGSVQTNRALNETVGGMKLLAGSANGMTEYDLRIWTETWVEPVIRQIVELEQYYEDDQEVLSIAGERAKIWKETNSNVLHPDQLDANVLVRVAVGIGAVDPSQQAAKLQQAFQMLAGLAQFFDRPVKVNAEEVAQAVFGFAGHKDGMKFLTMEDPQAQQPQQEDPKIAADQAKLQQETQLKQAELQQEAQLKQQEIASRERIAQQEVQGRMNERRMDAKLQVLMAALDHDFQRDLTSYEQKFASRMSGSQAMLSPEPAGQTPAPALGPM